MKPEFKILTYKMALPQSLPPLKWNRAAFTKPCTKANTEKRVDVSMELS